MIAVFVIFILASATALTDLEKADTKNPLPGSDTVTSANPTTQDEVASPTVKRDLRKNPYEDDFYKKISPEEKIDYVNTLDYTNSNNNDYFKGYNYLNKGNTGYNTIPTGYPVAYDFTKPIPSQNSNEYSVGTLPTYKPVVSTVQQGNNKKHIPIVSSNHEQNEHGYNFAYQTGNGISFQEQGYLKNDGKEGTNTVEGSYSYTGPDGVVYTVKYTADENGFRPVGDHLPTPPPIPKEIQEALLVNAQKQQVQNTYTQTPAYENNNYVNNNFNYLQQNHLNQNQLYTENYDTQLEGYKY